MNIKALRTIFVVLLASILLVTPTKAGSTIVWQAASTGLPAGGFMKDIAIGDFNNDGKLDLITAGTNGIIVSQGNGAGDWNMVGFSSGLPTVGQYGHVAVADFNQDGKLDIAATQIVGSEAVGAWVGDGAGNWAAWTGLPTGAFEGLVFSDVDKNGSPDLILGSGGSPISGIRVYLNTGSGFTETTPITATGQYDDLAASYVDNDGYIDIAAAGASGIRFWRGNLSGWTESSSGLPAALSYRGIALGDIDRDGKPDLLTSRMFQVNILDGGIFIYEYDPVANQWSLGPHQIPITGSYYKLQLTDLDQDGWPDLVASGNSTIITPGVNIWLGSAAGFTAGPPPTATAYKARVDVGDFDHNGLPDLAANGIGAKAWANIGIQDPIR